MDFVAVNPYKTETQPTSRQSLKKKPKTSIEIVNKQIILGIYTINISLSLTFILKTLSNMNNLEANQEKKKKKTTTKTDNSFVYS